MPQLHETLYQLPGSEDCGHVCEFMWVHVSTWHRHDTSWQPGQLEMLLSCVLLQRLQNFRMDRSCAQQRQWRSPASHACHKGRCQGGASVGHVLQQTSEIGIGSCLNPVSLSGLAGILVKSHATEAFLKDACRRITHTTHLDLAKGSHNQHYVTSTTSPC